MSSIKKIGIILLVAILLALMSASFLSNDILNRSIIIGIGLDLSEDNQLIVTAEVVSPGNGGEQVGTFSKTVTVQGETISSAVQKISQKTGKEASLGQCALLILGESLYTKVDFSQVIDFFINSYNFKESSTICCSKGSAKDILNYGEALSQSVSLALIAMLQEQSKSIGIPTKSLLEYARSQEELLCTGFVNYVEFLPSPNQDEQNPDKVQGYFCYDKLAVFRSNEFVDVMDEKLTKGLSILTKDVDGEVFVVEQEKEKITFIVGQKDIETKVTDGVCEVKVKLYGRLARTDDFGSNGILTVQTEQKLPERLLQAVQQEATAFILQFFAYQQQHNVDLINLHESYRQKHGTTDFVKSFAMDQIEMKLTVQVKQR